MMLVRYELQKVLSKRSNQIVLILLAVLVAYTCKTAITQVEWVDAQGNFVTGHLAAVKLQETRAEWSGSLDQELLEKALAELKEIYGSTEVDVQTKESNYLLRNKLQSVQEIADLLGWAFLNDYSTFEEMVVDLNPDDLVHFYEKRIENRRTWLYEDKSSWGYYNYSTNEKQYLLDKFESMETPMEVSYHEGWVQANEQVSTLLKYGIIFLGFMLAGIFSDEFALRTDAIYFSTTEGRTRSAIIKIGLGFLLITMIYWLCVGGYSLTVLGSLGTGGANCFIQSHANYWYMRENITFLQKYILTIFSGYLGYLFIGFLVMWISAKTKSTVLAVLTPALLILLPEFLHNFYSPAMRRIIGILPDKLLDIGEAIQYLYLYTIEGHIMTDIPIMLMTYPCISIILVLLCYRTYRNKEIV